MTPEELGAALVGHVEGARAGVDFGQLTVTVPRDRWVQAVTTARDDDALGCSYFDMLCGVDEGAEGFAVVTHLYSPSRAHRLLLRTVVPRDDARVASITGVFRGADWHERETFEMFGVVFEGHPRLVPLLLPDNFGAHPLRKEFELAARVDKAWPGLVEPGERR